MEPCIQREGISEDNSSSNDTLGSGDQCWEELWMPDLQPTATHNARDITQSENTDTFRHVRTNALEDTSSNFDTAITPISLPEIKEPSPATLAHDLTSFESEHFEMRLNAFGALSNIEDGLIEPKSPEIPLFPPGDIHPTFSENPMADDYYPADASVDTSFPSPYLCLSNNIPYVMDVNSTSAPQSLSTTPGFDDFEKPNGSEMRYQLVRKLAPAAEAQFMTCQQRITNDEHLLVPVTGPRKRRQCFDPLKREKVKQVRRLGACLRCRMHKEPVSSMLDRLSTID